MGQASNSGRNASLDDRKQRAAGRQEQNNPQQQEIDDTVAPNYARGKTGGAFGEEETPSTGRGRGSIMTGGAGDGGASTTVSTQTPAETPRSDQPTRRTNP